MALSAFAFEELHFVVERHDLLKVGALVEALTMASTNVRGLFEQVDLFGKIHALDLLRVSRSRSPNFSTVLGMR